MVRVLLLLPVLAAAARAEETVRHQDDGRRFSLALPKSWKATPTADVDTALKLTCEAGDDWVVVAVHLLRGARGALVQAHYERGLRAPEEETDEVTVEPGPPPRMVRKYRDGDEPLLDVVTFFMKKRNGLSVRLTCAPHAWPRLEAAYRSIVASLEADVHEWPPHPPLYPRRERGDVVWFIHEDVGKGEVNRLQGLWRTVERRFDKVHGKAKLDKDYPPFATVCRGTVEFAALDPESASPTYGAALDYLGGRVLLTPIAGTEGSAEEAQAAANMWLLLYSFRYGRGAPWLWSAEYSLAWSEFTTGEEAPIVNTHTMENLPGDPMPFPQLRALPTIDAAAGHHATAWALYLRCGPAKVRRAWAAFQKDYAETKDAVGAAERRLAPLDTEDVRQDLRKWLAKEVKLAPRR